MDSTEVEIGDKEQGIAVFDGSGAPLVLIDTMSVEDVSELVTEPVARRVLAARLRAWADVMDAIAGQPS